MLRVLERFRPYLVLGFVYLAANIILRCVDFILLAPLFNVPLNAAIFIRCILNDFIWCGCVFTAFIPVYYILRYYFKNGSVVICSLIFGLFYLLQIIIVIYAFYSGKPLDKEIFLRPFNEIYTTIKSYGNILLIISFSSFVIISFPILSRMIEKRIAHRYRILLISSAIILVLSVFMIQYPYQLYAHNTQSNRFIINRALYFIYEDFHYLRKGQELSQFNPELLSEFKSEYPGWQMPDSLMPFLRSDNTPDVLSPFFNLRKEKPSIVFIIVESLGRGISGKDAWSGSFTPFLDSIADHSLYWGNCITTAQRSFGILPSLLGSLPNGNTGFQFGKMPAHQSLISLLKKNGYSLNMFYAGYYEFDRVKDFMDFQGTDYYAPYYEEFKQTGFKQKKANEWGYADEILFERSLNEMPADNDQPYFNLYVTISTHNVLEIPEKEKYISAAKSINDKLSLNQQKRNHVQIDYLASFVYVDEALKHFFDAFKNRPEYHNTIFVITGDHYIANFGNPNLLSLYHVPLLIYSPLLRQPRYFNSMVSVLDVTPSLWAMLSRNFGLKKPALVSWISDGLDTTRNFWCRKKVVLMQDNRDCKEFVYNNYFLSGDSIYEIRDKLMLKPAPPELYPVITGKFRLFKAIHTYVYNEQKLIPDSLMNWSGHHSAFISP